MSTRGSRYLICQDSAQCEAAAAIVGAVYSVVSLDQAKNGHLAEISGNPIVLWPEREQIGTARAWGRELAVFGEVKIIAVDQGFCPTPTEMLAQEWDYDQFIAWVTGKEEHSTNLVELVTANIEDENSGVAPSVNSDKTRDKRAKHRGGDSTQQDAAEYPPKARTEQNSAAPQPEIPPFSRQADPEMDGSLGAHTGYLPASALDGAGAAEPHEEIPLEAYGEAQEPLSAEAAYTPYRSHDDAVGGSEWPTPANFWEVPQPPEMRSEWMPEALADYCMHEAETIGVDPGILGMYLIGFCCGAISDSIKLQVKADNPRWLQAARLWICVVGNSATKKSPALKEIDGPAWALERAMREQAISEVERYDDAMLVYEQQRKNYANEAAKGGTALAPEKPPRPVRNRLLVGDATREALADVLLDQGDRGVLVLADEIVSVFGSLDQYKKSGNDRQFYLQGYDGGPYVVDRKGRDVLINNLGFSIVGGTQPSALRKISHQLSLESDGLMQRFMPYVARLATEDIERGSHHAGHARYADILERLMDLQHSGPIKFSADAQKVRREFSQWAWEAAKGEWVGDALRSHVSKYDTFYARTCLTYHCIATADAHLAHVPAEIPADIARQVATLFQDCLFHHAAHFYTQVISSSSDLIHHVREIASKILAFQWHEISPTLLAQKMWSWRSFKDWEKRAIFTSLAEAGWTRTDDKRGYVPGVPIRYSVNPGLYSMFAEQAEIEWAIQSEKSERVTGANLRPRGKARRED